ncbi:hypothetical protein FPHOBKDP_00048 [Listeria phage LPJP1]|nr:hypothetical protein FPHOBKDP_00048 [Listeria phage LPJP1]
MLNKTKENYQKEILNRFNHFYLNSEGNYVFPNTLEGDLLSMTHKMITSQEKYDKLNDNQNRVLERMVFHGNSLSTISSFCNRQAYGKLCLTDIEFEQVLYIFTKNIMNKYSDMLY